MLHRMPRVCLTVLFVVHNPISAFLAPGTQCTPRFFEEYTHTKKFWSCNFPSASGSTSLQSSSFRDDVDEENEKSIDNFMTGRSDGLQPQHNEPNHEIFETSIFEKIVDGLPFIELFRARNKLPPIQVDDTNLLLYDIFLIVNLSLSISFWVTHRMDFEFLPYAFSEGCLLSIFWIVSGLYHGMFLLSSVDGHYGSTDERGGPKAAAVLALNTYVNAFNLRLIFAFIVAVLDHRPVGNSPGEQLLPLEIGFGLLLMSCWRAIHSYSTPRI